MHLKRDWTEGHGPEEADLRNISGQESLNKSGHDVRQPFDPSSCSWTTTSDKLEASIKTFLLEKSDLFSGTCVLVNALTVLDIILSRRTKPWRFFLRIVYRISRSNLKWAIFWFIWLVSSELGSQYLTDQLGSAVRSVMVTSPGLGIQRAWITMQSYQILSSLSFVIYSLIASWLLRHLMPRSDVHRDGFTRDSHSSVRTDQSKWGLLLRCLFRPVSFATAQNLTDLDFELDDSMELLIERLALPNLWLTPVVPTDYLKYLPVWQFNGWENPFPGTTVERPDDDELCDSGAALDHLIPLVGCITWNPNHPLCHPSGMIPSFECAICLDKYRSHIHVCGLPCGHHFHYECIMIWLQRDNHHCPICRWPAYRNKCLPKPIRPFSS